MRPGVSRTRTLCLTAVVLGAGLALTTPAQAQEAEVTTILAAAPPSATPLAGDPEPELAEAAEAASDAEPEEPPTIAAPSEGSGSQSRGLPDRGRLRRAVLLEEGPNLRFTAERATHYGTAELVGLVERVADWVAEHHAGARLSVGDLSRRDGGNLPPHRSHKSGRDVDLGFYLTDDEGAEADAARFVQIRRSGCGEAPEGPRCFDAARNWTLLVALVEDPQARVQYVFVAPDLRARVLEEGERRGASAALLERVRTVTAPHQGSHSHRSHFHVRIYCPLDDRPGCWDEPPFHAWYVGEPSGPPANVRANRARRRARARARAARQRRARQQRRRRRQRRARASASAPTETTPDAAD